MLHYSLAKQGKKAGRKKGTTALLPQADYRISSEIEYQKAMRAMLRALAKDVRESIIPAYKADLAVKRSTTKITVDADREWFSQLQALAVSLTRTAQNTVDLILNLEAQRHTATFAATVKRSIGIDVSSIISQEDLGDLLQVASGRNAGLIKSLSDDTVKKVEQAVYQKSLQGNSVKTLKKQLIHDFGVSESRAKLIARDQMGKMNSDLTRLRQEQSGIKKYKWLAHNGERTRELHRRIDGTVYQWGEATGAEQGLPPGQPINCRCKAIAIVEF